jgi:hypothetical protein
MGEGLQMLAFGILGSLYAQADSLLLLSLRGSVEAGFYSLAYRFYEAGLLLSNALAVALLPRLAGRSPRPIGPVASSAPTWRFLWAWRSGWRFWRNR